MNNPDTCCSFAKKVAAKKRKSALIIVRKNLLRAIGVLSAASACAWAGEVPTEPSAEKEPSANREPSADNAPTLVLSSDVTESPDIIVRGSRTRPVTTQEIRQSKVEIVDAVVEEDISKLPVMNVSDILQHVSGVQVARDRGEGDTLSIRGLSQMATTLNGHEIFTAGEGRSLNFNDVPSEMVAGVDVYKTSSARLIEGGLAGLVDIRTRRPFDYQGRRTEVSAGGIYGDLVDSGRAQYSALYSNRWDTAAGGEAGILLHIGRQQRAWREDQKGTGNPQARTDILPGQTVIAPNGTSESISAGLRERDAVSVSFQWSPSPQLELYAEGSHAQLITYQDSYQISLPATSTFVAGTPTLFSESQDLQSITWTDSPISVLSFARDTVGKTQQFATGGQWRGDSVTVKADLSHTRSRSSLFFSGLNLSSQAPEFSHDLSGSVPSTRVNGTDLQNPANYEYVSTLYRTRPFAGSQTAAQLEGAFQIDHPFIYSLETGTRFTRRKADNAPGLIFGDANVGNIPATSLPGYIATNPYGGFFPGSNSIDGYLAGDISTARDPMSLRDGFGIGLPPQSNPRGTWHIDEETQAAYLMANILTSDLRLDGNAGVRAVRTRTQISGHQTQLDSGAVVPVNSHDAYIDYLPSLTLRYQLSRHLYLRMAASKTLTRPNFNQLSPSLSLVRNSVNPSLNQGSAGNPALRPIRSDNLDLSLEGYFSRTTSAHLTLFQKKVDGFVMTQSRPELHEGELYMISRPQNSRAADIQGVELGYQQFYDFLPGILSGLGLQANYLYIDSSTFDNALGGNIPLQGLSRHSYNLVALYERGPLSARVAYNWRDKYLSGTTSVVGIGALPIYTGAHAWLDAAIQYQFTPDVSVMLEGLNLSGTQRTSYYGVKTRPQSSWVNDRQVRATLTVAF
ncbi:TonB-dependent receptor [Nitrincola sp. MINF-07-Sa-05]|uniref:TonB-dependent receptor n=1 Tax=Nitrincola salilacus TaxID=3400273 RepID=UPI00391808B6